MLTKSLKGRLAVADDKLVGASRCIVLVWDGLDQDAEQAVADLFADGSLRPDDAIVCLPSVDATELDGNQTLH